MNDFVLFLHITLVIVSLSLATVLHTALLLLRAARDVSAVRAWPAVISVVEPLLPVGAIAVLATGLWLLSLSDGEFALGDGWVIASIVGLVGAELVGALLAPRSKALREAIKAAPDGPLDADLRRRTLDPALWLGAHAATATFLAIVFVMAVKPTGVVSGVVIAVVALLGALSGLPFTRPARTAQPLGSTGG